MSGPLFRIMALWGRQTGWLLAGLMVSLTALLAGVGLMAVSGLTIGAAVLAGALAMPTILRSFGGARVVLRYVERLITHDAMFRALADMRVWFFRRLAATSAGGLGFRQAGDLLARLQIHLPEVPDPDLETFAEAWRANRPYTPRRKG